MSEQMCEKLRQCNCEASSLCIKDRDHMTIVIRLAQDTDPATQAMLEFIAKHVQ
jgi:hypothetical protein